MEIYDIAPNHKLINIQAPIPGYENFLGSHLLCGEKKAIVDVGPKVAVPIVLSALARLNTSPEKIDYVILTHIHIDHAGGAGTALKEMSRAKVIAHGRARSHLVDPTVLWKASLEALGELAVKYGSIEPVPEDRIVVATDLMKIDLGGGWVWEVHLTPGHSPHHLSLFDRRYGVLIAGEAAGGCVNGIIRPATPPPFRLKETLASIDRLIALEPRQVCFSHFGCFDNAPEKLRLAKQKLLDWCEIVSSAAKGGKNLDETIAMLREKDKSLDYLNTLSKDEYRREHGLLVNSIKGMRDSVRESG